MTRSLSMVLQGSRALVLSGLAALALQPGSASAHGIQSTLERLNNASATLESSFSTGVPASAAVVRLVPPDGGTPIVVGHTDASGRLAFTVPKQAGGDWELQVDAGPGHRDYLELREASRGAGPAAMHHHGRRGQPWFAFAWGSLLMVGWLSQRRRG